MKKTVCIILLVLAAGAAGYAVVQWRGKGAGSTPPVTTYDNVVITMERTACFGVCPDYRVRILGDGTVTYEGKAFVTVTGTRTAHIPSAQVKKLVDEFYRADFFSFEDRYAEKCQGVGRDRVCALVTDLPTVATSFTNNGRTKAVQDYYGAPDALKSLEQKIDEIAGTAQWVKGPGDEAGAVTPTISPEGQLLNYAEGSRPQNSRYELTPEGILVTWGRPTNNADIARYKVEFGGPVVYQKAGETTYLSFLVHYAPDASLCNMRVRITPIDRAGALMLPAYVQGITRKVREGDCGPQR